MPEGDQTIDADATVLDQSVGIATPSHPTARVGTHTVVDGPEIYKATYSGVMVFEKVIRGVTVMRRKTDSAFNATQLLKVAGLDKAKRTKTLEKEVHTGAHEKVQGGYGKFQGTWVPYDRAVAISQQYDIYEDVKPLLLYNPANSAEETPTKEQVIARASRNNSFANNNGTHKSISRQPSALGRTYSTLTDNDNDDIDMMQDRKRPRFDVLNSLTVTSESQTPEARNPTFKTYSHDIEMDNPNAPYALDPVSGVPPELEERSRGIITQIFLSEDGTPIIQALGGNESVLDGINLDLAIDENGHTALHWAASLARTQLVEDLVARGAIRIRGNNHGESPLVHAVVVTNNYDKGSFFQLLDILYPCIPVLDHTKRSVLHHIALTAGIKQRSQASRYYLETLLEWIVKTGSNLKKGGITLGRFMSEIVNGQDKNGDTCLNIAARIGNKAIIQQLLDVGADPSIPNNANLRPIDFGINVNGLNTSSLVSAMAKPAAPASSTSSAQQSSKKILDSMHQVLMRLDADFKGEISAKQKTIDDLHSQLRDSTQKLSNSRKTLDTLKQSETKLGELKQRIANLDRATEEEEQRFIDQTTELASIGDYDVDFDADEPFRIEPVYDQVAAQLDRDPDMSLEKLSVLRHTINPAHLPPANVLRARLNAYRENESQLGQLITTLKQNSQELENKFRRVVALCTGVEESKIDTILDGLVQAVESDPDEVDMGRVVGFLKKVDA